MPTVPDQDGAFFDSVGIQRPRTGPAGVPRTGGLAAPTNVPPRAPSILGPGAQPGGRPPGAAPSTAPQGPPISQVGTGIPAAAPTAPQVQINLPTGQAPGAPSVPGQGEAPLAAQPTRAMLPSIPTRRQMRAYPPGTLLETPYGPIEENPQTGRRSIRLTPEGQALFARDKEAMMAKMPPNAINADPNAPKPPIVPGQMFYDPFSGRFIS